MGYISRVLNFCSFFFLASLFSLSCQIHFTQIYSNRPKADVEIPAEKVSIEYERIDENGVAEIKNFNNRDFDSVFRDSRQFILSKESNLKVVYSSDSLKIGENDQNTALFALTAGAIPLKTDSQSNVNFKVIDKRKGKELASYDYFVKQASWFGWLSIPISVFVWPFADTVKELTTNEGFDFHDRITARFTEDFYSDYKKGIFSGYTKPQNKKPKFVYIVLEGNETEKKYREESKMLTNLVEVALSRGRFKLSDRKNISQVLKEQAMSESGLSKDDTHKIGQLSGAQKIVISNVIYYKDKGETYNTSYIIHITDIQSGEVEWKNLYSIEERNIDTLFLKGSTELMKDLEFAGYR